MVNYCDYIELFNYIPVKCEKNHSDEEEKFNCQNSHNRFEIDFHFLKYKILFCRDPDCTKKDCHHAHNSEDFRKLIKIKRKINDINIFKKTLLSSIFFKEIIVESHARSLPEKFDLSTYKVLKCPFAENCLAFEKDYHNCLNYHNEMERRRDPHIYQIDKNEYCKAILNEKHLLDPKQCGKGVFCEYHHTRNELNYDKRNFRVVVHCERNKGKKCVFYDVCYGRHVEDEGSKGGSGSSVIILKSIKDKMEELIDLFEKCNVENDHFSTKIQNLENKILSLKCQNEHCVEKFNTIMCVMACKKHYFCQKCVNNNTCLICKKSFGDKDPLKIKLRNLNKD